MFLYNNYNNQVHFWCKTWSNW